MRAIVGSSAPAAKLVSPTHDHARATSINAFTAGNSDLVSSVGGHRYSAEEVIVNKANQVLAAEDVSIETIKGTLSSLKSITVERRDSHYYELRLQLKNKVTTVAINEANQVLAAEAVPLKKLNGVMKDLDNRHLLDSEGVSELCQQLQKKINDTFDIVKILMSELNAAKSRGATAEDLTSIINKLNKYISSDPTDDASDTESFDDSDSDSDKITNLEETHSSQPDTDPISRTRLKSPLEVNDEISSATIQGKTATHVNQFFGNGLYIPYHTEKQCMGNAEVGSHRSIFYVEGTEVFRYQYLFRAGDEPEEIVMVSTKKVVDQGVNDEMHEMLKTGRQKTSPEDIQQFANILGITEEMANALIEEKQLFSPKGKEIIIIKEKVDMSKFTNRILPSTEHQKDWCFWDVQLDDTLEKIISEQSAKISQATYYEYGAGNNCNTFVLNVLRNL